MPLKKKDVVITLEPLTVKMQDLNLKNKIERAILRQDKEKLEDLIKKITKEFPDRFIIELTLLKWKYNKWDETKREWSLGRDVKTCPACKKFALIWNRCVSLCPIARVEGTSCLGSEFYDNTRHGNKELMIKRIEAAMLSFEAPKKEEKGEEK